MSIVSAIIHGGMTFAAILAIVNTGFFMFAPRDRKGDQYLNPKVNEASCWLLVAAMVDALFMVGTTFVIMIFGLS